MSPAAMNFSSSDTTPHSPLHFAPFNADATIPVGSTARGKSRPRLTKLRKQSATQNARSRTRTADAVDDEVSGSGSGFGFNPFRSDQVSDNFKGVETDSGSFVFSARKIDSDSVRDLNSEQKESEVRKSGGVEFVFSAKEIDSKSNSILDGEKKNSERNTSNSEGEKGKVNFTGFVFGAGRNDLHSSFNIEKGKSSVPDGKERECKTEFVFGDKQHIDIKMSSFNVEKKESVDSMRNSNNGSGVFHAATETNSSFDKDADKCGNLGNDVKSKSGKGSTNGFTATFNDISGSKLVDEIKKLNINHPEGVRIARDSTKSGVSSSNGFVFGGSDKVSSVSSGTNTSGEQLYTNVDFENIGRQYAKAGRKDDVKNGTACGIAQDATGIPCSKTSTSQGRIGDFQCGKIPEFHVSEDAQVNGAEESCTDFKPPAWDPSCFKDNLFCNLNKKFESTHKTKPSKDKGSNFLRRKSKSHSLNKKQTRIDHLPKENSSLETPESSGGFSPMDFSPYQETAADDQDLKASEELNVLHPSLSIPTDYKDDLTSNSEKKKADIFHFVNGLGDSKEKDFAFSAGSTVEGTSSLYKRKQKKFRRKMGCGKPVSSAQFSPITTPNVSSLSDVTDKSQMNDQLTEGGDTSLATIEAACYQWRLRGNRAHKAKDLSKAEEFYTKGIDSVPSSERSGCCSKPLLLCYSNRAATRISLGRIREALEDCMRATSLDPTFLKVQMRTANCHLLLGEFENAQQCYNKCLESGKVVCLDRRVIVEAAEGLQKAQEVVKCMNDAAELLKQRTSDAAGSALELLTKALSKSLYSERLLQMKAEALYLLQKYDAAIQLCEQSLKLAEKNFASPNSANNSNNSTHDSYSSVKLWRWSLISKCYFRLGRLDASLNIIEKLRQTASVNDKCVIDNNEDLLSLAATIHELLDHRKAGNENFKLQKYAAAVENYTAALSSNIKSRPFAAICFGNRAAAHQASGQIADAIADCSMAMALDGNYAKAISRRATLHEMVRDYEQAACDLRRLISVLGSQSNEKAKHSDSPNGSTGGKESRQAQQRLLTVEDQAKMGTPLDFYLILGIKPADTAADIKKAYHKAALRHHPDKAGQLLARSEVGDEGHVWKEISQEVHKDADRLFKMIGEAYAVLSDTAKRSEYDMEENIRKTYKQSNGGSAGRRSSDVYGNGRSSDGYRSAYDRTSNRRYGYHWRTYGDSYSRW
ncbi:unnamed protein product [Trifolium pratense]|uniref:Uncharacterized protein n=1 Tax=Trifolium pratense TaxID=57577 RepID=A0ACB0LQP2_TRIPR|nr:unnamed protein product [Trifolium pratense]